MTPWVSSGSYSDWRLMPAAITLSTSTFTMSAPGDRRQRCTNALGKIRRIIGRLRSLVDQGSPPQFVEWQRRVHPAGVVELTVDQAVEEMPDIESADPASGVCVAHDVDRAAVAQQMIEFRSIGEFVDPRQIDQQQPPRISGRGIEAIEVYGLFAIVGAHAHEVTLVTHHVDQLELLEHGGDGRKTLAYLGPRLDGNT